MRRLRRQAWRGRGHRGRGASAAGCLLAKAPAWPSECQANLALFVCGHAPDPQLFPKLHTRPTHTARPNIRCLPLFSPCCPRRSASLTGLVDGGKQLSSMTATSPAGGPAVQVLLGPLKEMLESLTLQQETMREMVGGGPRACVYAWSGVALRVCGECGWHVIDGLAGSCAARKHALSRRPAGGCGG
jgi:hypothetical protein